MIDSGMKVSLLANQLLFQFASLSPHQLIHKINWVHLVDIFSSIPSGNLQQLFTKLCIGCSQVSIQ